MNYGVKLLKSAKSDGVGGMGGVLIKMKQQVVRVFFRFVGTNGKGISHFERKYQTRTAN